MRQRLAPVAERLRFLPLVAFAALLTASVLLGGCATLGYYAQSISGHLELMSLREPVDGLISDDGTPQDLRARLETATEMREFAHLALDLPDNGSYRSYVGLDRPYGDPEDTLAASEYIDQLICIVCCVDRYAVAQQRHVGERAVALELRAEQVHRGANLLEAHPGVEESFYDPQLDDVLERIAALRA